MWMLALVLGCRGYEQLYDVDGDGFTSYVDCDDYNAAIHPDAVEVHYDGVDQDCDGADDFDADGDGALPVAYEGTDCDDTDPTVAGDPTSWWPDCDGDGAPQATPLQVACGTPSPAEVRAADPCGGERFPAALLPAPGTADCDDRDALRAPGRADAPYDGIDADCDGTNDFDADGDGFVRRGYAASAGGSAPGVGDCDDTDPSVHPGAHDPDDGIDADCDGFDETDRDADGARSAAFGGDDCDDDDPARSPLLDEVGCDGLDNDCDPSTPDGPDQDGDGFACGLDCNDGDPAVRPDATEVCNGRDDDCDGAVDEGLVTQVWLDADGDGFGFGAALSLCPRPGLVENDDDCNDTRGDQFPGNPEVCDGRDNDCDGAVDEGLPVLPIVLDLDGDGAHGTPIGEACALPPGASAVVSDCDDLDPLVVEGFERFADCDEDGYGAASLVYCQPGELQTALQQVCGTGGRAVATQGDCDDTLASVRPFAFDRCDGVDQDCDGVLDEDETAWQDADGDGLGGDVPVACGTGVTNQLDACDDDPARWRGDSVVGSGADPVVLADELCTGSVLQLEGGLFSLGSDWVIENAIVVRGAGPSTVIDGQGLFHVDVRASADLADLVLRNGAGSVGGCLVSSADTALTGVGFDGCDAVGDGGCVHLGGPAVFDQVTMHECTAGGVGGAAYAGSTLDATDWTAELLDAENDPMMNITGVVRITGGTFRDAEADDYGLHVRSGGRLECTDCLFEDVRTRDASLGTAAGLTNQGSIVFDDVEVRDFQNELVPVFRNYGAMELYDLRMYADCPDCSIGFSNTGSVLWRGGFGTPPLTIGAALDVEGVDFTQGALGVFGATAPVRLVDVTLAGGFVRLQSNQGAEVRNAAFVLDASSMDFWMDNQGAAPFVLDQVSVLTFGSTALYVGGSGPFQVSDVVVQGTSGSALSGNAGNFTGWNVFGLGVDLTSPLFPGSCTDCGAYPGESFADAPADWSVPAVLVGAGSGDGCAVDAPPACFDPGFLDFER